MSAIQDLEFYKKQIKDNKTLEHAFWCDCEFRFEDNIDIKKDLFVCGEDYVNYNLYPFGNDGSGGIYVLLDDKYVGYFSSEGECGIIAESINDFFNILVTCKFLYNYFRKGVFESFDEFLSIYNYNNNELNLEYENHIYDSFIKENNLETDVKRIFEKFRRGIIIEPQIIAKVTFSDEYAPWDDLFSSNQKYINELREKINS